MNIQEVIKGLECCKVGCKDCPYYGEQECILKVRDDALEVLKEQCRFMEFLYNVINPNELEAYLRMYLALPIPTNGERTKE